MTLLRTLAVVLFFMSIQSVGITTPTNSLHCRLGGILASSEAEDWNQTVINH